MKYSKRAYYVDELRECGVTSCRKAAVAQFYICALKGHVAVCRHHDRELNKAALSIATNFNFKETMKWIDQYHGPSPTGQSRDSSLKTRSNSPAASRRKSKRGAQGLLSSGPSSPLHWEWD
jgi:hypothetical protein